MGASNSNQKELEHLLDKKCPAGIPANLALLSIGAAAAAGFAVILNELMMMRRKKRSLSIRRKSDDLTLNHIVQGTSRVLGCPFPSSVPTRNPPRDGFLRHWI
ncbi:unnamed protein product [Lepeophtheirus salmonis]|uniref:(salmon louse) hypothetical protein n=1 Tax=Lepeophtheirus salmonis TaxID=72036 RepID=A0A7R8HA41_LEPSM|nr:unnamed protein product [Lepeophtheirus salmonis]CAF2966876.1 unnamed protein product [Lepeophtheirus salmonis]